MIAMALIVIIPLCIHQINQVEVFSVEIIDRGNSWEMSIFYVVKDLLHLGSFVVESLYSIHYVLDKEAFLCP